MLKYGVIGVALSLVSLGVGKSTNKGFYDAPEWSRDKAEILEYSVKKFYFNKEFRFKASMVSEGFYYSPNQGKFLKKPGSNFFPIIKSTLMYSFKRFDSPRHVISTIKVFRVQDIPLVEEAARVISWEGQISRILTSDKDKSAFFVDSWMEGVSRLSFKEIPVWSVEQLFLKLREIDFKTFTTRQIGFMYSFLEDQTDTRVYHAEIELHKNTIKIQDQETRQITVTVEDGKVFEFWLRVSGLHNVVLAKFPDGTVFTLNKMEWRKYRVF